MSIYFKKSEFFLPVITLVIVCFTSIIVSFYSESVSKREEFETVTVVFNCLFAPVQKLFWYLSYHVSSLSGYLEDVNELKKENERLYSFLEHMEIERQKNDAVYMENKFLKKILDLKQNKPDLKVEVADVIAKNPLNFNKTFTINLGSENKIKPNQIVMTEDSVLLGRVWEVNLKSSKVLTLFDEKNALGARVVRSLEPGVIENYGNSFIYKMTAISKFSDIILGDTIETSGSGGIYPPGLIIGKVRDIKTEKVSISEYALVEPGVDLNKIVKVLVGKTN